MSAKISNTKKQKVNPVHEIYDALEIIVVSLTLIFIIFTFFARITYVDGESMEDTLYDKDLLILSKVAYTPKRGDIVVLQDISLNQYYSQPLVKRVIATGGQEIDIDFDTWEVTVDGEIIDEPYIKLMTDQRVTSNFDFPLTVPENEVFVMGDNRNHSGDSRSAYVGTIDERCIIGKAYFRLKPFNRAGYLY